MIVMTSISDVFVLIFIIDTPDQRREGERVIVTLNYLLFVLLERGKIGDQNNGLALFNFPVSFNHHIGVHDLMVMVEITIIWC